VHPTTVATPMILNEPTYRLFRPDLENPTREDFEVAARTLNKLPVAGAWDMFAGHQGGTEQDMVEGGYSFTALKGTSFMDPQVIADTALYLNSSLAAKVTGVTIPVDAGHLILTGINPSPVR
jgi:NAD(P)-dependent dehydrogenase (short-subunit alcohol dehydrogenase family)